jgi:hypothetical protein
MSHLRRHMDFCRHTFAYTEVDWGVCCLRPFGNSIGPKKVWSQRTLGGTLCCSLRLTLTATMKPQSALRNPQPDADRAEAAKGGQAVRPAAQRTHLRAGEPQFALWLAGRLSGRRSARGVLRVVHGLMAVVRRGFEGDGAGQKASYKRPQKVLQPKSCDPRKACK